MNNTKTVKISQKKNEANPTLVEHTYTEVR